MLRLTLFTSLLLVCALALSAVHSAEGLNPFEYQPGKVAMWEHGPDIGKNPVR